MLEQLILRLTFEMSLEESDFENDRALLESDDFEFELMVKKKVKLRLIDSED